MKSVLPLLTLFIMVQCSTTSKEEVPRSEPQMTVITNPDKASGKPALNKINGASLEMPRNKIKPNELTDLNKNNVEWLAMIPYSFSRPGETFVKVAGDGNWWGESPKGIIDCIKMAHSGGMKVMLKPHVWVGGGQGWLGDFEFDSDAKWEAWEANFSDYILSYAKIADSLNVELFCVGTEVRKSAAKRPHFWRKLIKDVRTVYDGKVTYAANWDNYMNVNFWDEVDYIGIDAYFPLSDSAIPDKEELINGWNKLSPKLEKLSEKYDAPILFTEFGYKSVEHTNMGHWKYKEDTLKTSHLAQKVAYEGLFESIWQKDFIAGGFYWKHHFKHMMRGDYLDRRYTPQGKQAEVIIKEWYGRP